MVEEEKHSPPERDASDVIHTVVKAGLSAIPIIGGPAAELFAAVVTPPLDRRRQSWMEEIAEGLRQLEEDRGVKLEDLQQNEAFVDTALLATQAALRTSQQEKRRALRNAILNAALPGPPGQSLQQVFVNLIDTMTEWHLQLLHLFHDPKQWFEERKRKVPDHHMGALSTILEVAFPELKGQRGFYDQVWRDLYLRGLVNTDGLHTMMTGGGLFQRRSTEMGARFLLFIADPT